MADPTTGNHVVIVGGVSVNDPGGHDAYPYNFINPGAKRAIAFGKNVHLILYEPSYEIRVRDQLKEHSSVTITMVDDCYVPMVSAASCPSLFKHKVKNVHHFLEVVRRSADKNGFGLSTIRTADDLTAKLNDFDAIETIHYFGHSNADYCFLQYSTTGKSPAIGEVVWGLDDAKKVDSSKFIQTATFATYGCNQGEVGALADQLRTQWKIRTIGSEGKTSYVPIGQGQAFPESASGYYQYPTPALGADKFTWTYPARRPLPDPF
jgi:hypothetical protein